MHPYVHCGIISNSQAPEAAQEPISRWVDKKAVVHLHNGILVGHKKEGNVTICHNMDGPREYCAKWNNPFRETNTIWFHLRLESNEQNKLTSKIGTDSQIQRMGWQLSEGRGWETEPQDQLPSPWPAGERRSCRGAQGLLLPHFEKVIHPNLLENVRLASLMLLHTSQ